jgi:hypothetical protein
MDKNLKNVIMRLVEEVMDASPAPTIDHLLDQQKNHLHHLSQIKDPIH